MRRRASGTVTVLITDLAGSTELMAHMGGAAFDEFRRTHFATLREATVRSGGEEIKTLGDGMLAIFGSASDAVACAVAMQQAVDRQARQGPTPLAIRVGLALGEVRFEEGDVFGTPVVEAARLVSAARGGQVLASALVRAVAGGWTAARFADVGLLELKGLPEPVAVCEVAWEPLPAPLVPMPSLLTDTGRIFVGRDDELELLRKAWKEAVSGERCLALIGGEPGVGKTRLVAELARAVHGEGATVLAGRCDEDLGVPYQPFVEALRHLTDHVSGPEVARRLGRHGGDLVRLLPDLAESVPGLSPPLHSDPETERYRLFDAVAGWLAATATDQPVLLVLDDLQWAAKPTLLLLRHVLRSSVAPRVLVAAIYRDTELGRTHPLTEMLADLRRDTGVVRIPLTGLDESAVAVCIERAAGHDLGDEAQALARTIHRETEGNPFFVWEVLRHLAETGAIRRRDGRWEAGLPVEELGIPEGVRDVVGRRLSRLSETVNRVLALAAVMGQDFDPALVTRAGSFDEDEVLGGMDEARAAGIVAEVAGPTPQYRFAHALVRDTLYGELSAARRVVLHRRVAEAMEALYAPHLDNHLSALAHHYARAAAPAAETLKAVTYATLAGDRALAQLAHDEAANWYRQALEFLDAFAGPVDEGQRCHLLILLGEAQRRAGDAGHRQTLLNAVRIAEALGDSERLARAALANNRGFFSVSEAVDADRVAALDAALRRLGPEGSALRARLLVTLAAELTFSPDYERRDRLVTEALVLARRLGNLPALGYVLATSYVPAFGRLNVGELRDNTTELARVAEQLGDPALSFWARQWGFMTAVLVGDFPAGDRLLDDAVSRANEIGHASMRWVSRFEQSHRCRMTGRLEEAETLARQALELGQAAGLPDASWIFGTQLFWLRYDQGRLDEFMDLLARAASRDDASPFTRAALCVALCELDRSHEARPVFEDLAADAFAAIPFHYSWLYGMTMLAEVCARLDDQERAQLLYERLAPHHQLVATVGAVSSASVAHYLGLLAATLGRHDDAEAHFAEAAGINERVGAPAWLARTRLGRARMLLARRQPEDAERARELLGQALATARELGLANVERDAARLDP